MKPLEFAYNQSKENRKYDLIKNIKEDPSINPVIKILIDCDSSFLAGEIIRQAEGEKSFCRGILNGYFYGKGFNKDKIEKLKKGMKESIGKIDFAREYIINSNKEKNNYSLKDFHKDLKELRGFYDQLFKITFDYIEKWEMYNNLFKQK